MTTRFVFAWLLSCTLVASAADLVPPTIVSVNPLPGTRSSLTQITINFSEVVQGVNATDLLIAGLPADSVTAQGAAYTFAFAQPPAGLVAIGWASSHGITDTAIPPNPF